MRCIRPGPFRGRARPGGWWATLLLSAFQISCAAGVARQERLVELEDGQAATWSERSDEPLLQVDVNAILGSVRLFGDGRVLVHDAFARRGQRESGLRLSRAELDELVRFVVGSGVLREDGAEARYERSYSSHPSTWRLRVRLGTYRDERGKVTRGYERSFGATDIRLDRRHLAGDGAGAGRGLAAVLARLVELSRSPDLRPVEAIAAEGVPEWARAVEGRAPRIVYRVSQGRGIATLRTIDWTGRDERPLLSIRAPDLVLSPDGSAVAYVRAEGLTVRSLATGREIVLVPGVDRAHSLLWSPDGAELAFSAEIGERYYHLFVAAADGSGWEPLTDAGAKPLAWSPDGRRIYYEQHRRGVQQMGAHTLFFLPNVFVTGRTGFGEVPVVPWPVGSFSLAPDGRRAAYVSGDYTSHSPERAKASLLWVARLDPQTGGRRVGRVALSVGEGSGAQWSADGRSLLCSRGRSIEIVRTDGRGRAILRREEIGNRYLTNLRWAPDESAILFVRKPIVSGQRLGGMPEIWVMGRDGSDPRFLAEGVWAEWMPETDRASTTVLP